VFIGSDGKVCINTTSPVTGQQLTVKGGGIALGDGAELFALGATQDLRVIAGTVPASGSSGVGSGFNWSFDSFASHYVVTFAPPYPSGSTPMVLANTVGAGFVATVLTVASTQFTLAVSALGGQASFNFVVLGPRT
jgi:hypothetical protein